jgi:DNA helicase-2/ATP-dependent DNA helicase PcrA
VDEGELEEERRLCYVAITRAKKNLYMTHCAERSLYGKIMNNADSCFLDEIDSDHLNVVKKASIYRNNYYGGFYKRY